MKRRGRQLYTLTSEAFRLPFFVDANGNLVSARADQIPVIHWPNGSWCHPANRFMRELYERGLSRRDRGGTLATYAAHISHLVRFCWLNGTDPIDMNDNAFVRFIHELEHERVGGEKAKFAREANAVIAIGRSCLEFLDSVGHHMGDSELVSHEGRICGEKRVFAKKTGDRARVITRTYWHHRCFPKPSATRRRLPISSDAIAKLRSAVATTSRSPSLRKRRYVTLKVYEITGTRRGEVALIRVEAVRSAAKMAFPMLEVPAIKRPGGKVEKRLVPISRMDLRFLMEYIEVNRPVALRQLGRRAVDHGLLLVSDTTGLPLKPQTLTTEMRLLAKHAGLQERASPHLFRHRFITKLFVALIEQHRVSNEDEFRRLLLDSKVLMKKVAEWTGHKSLESLDQYIHLAFEEVANFSKSYSLVRARQIVDSLAGTLDQVALELACGDAPEALVGRLIGAVGECKRELMDLDAA